MAQTWTPCPECDGKRFFYINGDDTMPMNCPTCKGSGDAPEPVAYVPMYSRRSPAFNDD